MTQEDAISDLKSAGATEATFSDTGRRITVTTASGKSTSVSWRETASDPLNSAVGLLKQWLRKQG